MAAAVKTVRSAIRLKYSLLADREINDVLPTLENDMAVAAAKGKAFTPALLSAYVETLETA